MTSQLMYKPVFNRNPRTIGHSHISVVMMTHERSPDELYYSLGSLSAQTKPPYEIIVVDTNWPDINDVSQEISEVIANYPLAKHIRRPRRTFSLSYGINVGVQNTNPSVRYVMSTCPENVFSDGVLEWLDEHMSAGRFYIAPIGRLPKGNVFPEDVWAEWDFYMHHIEGKYPPDTFSLGTFLIFDRPWWFKVRGYDEVNHPFNWADSDMTSRAKKDGKKMYCMPWEDGQVLHIWHDLSPHFYGVTSPYPDGNREVVRNPHRWGDIFL